MPYTKDSSIQPVVTKHVLDYLNVYDNMEYMIETIDPLIFTQPGVSVNWMRGVVADILDMDGAYRDGFTGLVSDLVNYALLRVDYEELADSVVTDMKEESINGRSLYHHIIHTVFEEYATYLDVDLDDALDDETYDHKMIGIANDPGFDIKDMLINRDNTEFDWIFDHIDAIFLSDNSVFKEWDLEPFWDGLSDSEKVSAFKVLLEAYVD